MEGGIEIPNSQPPLQSASLDPCVVRHRINGAGCQSTPLLGQPIGFVRSCFKCKNGTPRQPSVCSFSRATIKVRKDVFPNPQHSVEGLAVFSHIWILFTFHKNGVEKCTKAKVKPPRLDGGKVGVFATRSPHRPNPIGLTLAKLDRIEGDTLFVSGVDIIDGTPVLDIKPYVPSYDNPTTIQQNQLSNRQQTGHQMTSTGTSPCLSKTPNVDGLSTTCSTIATGYTVDGRDNGDEYDLTNSRESSEYSVNHRLQNNGSSFGDADNIRNPTIPAADDRESNDKKASSSSVRAEETVECLPRRSSNGGIRHSKEVYAGVSVDDPPESSSQVAECSHVGSSEVTVPDWIQCPPIAELEVRFTESAEKELKRFSQGSADTDTRLEFLKDCLEARQAISEILAADPRSTYRRNSCGDRLYFFTVDTIHVTCWFGSHFVEVVRAQPIGMADI